MAIYTKFGKQPTIKEFLMLLFSSVKNNSIQNVETYSDEACLIIQCDKNKYRSFDDVFECVSTYYPNASVKEILEELILLNPIIELVNKTYLYTFYCTYIRKLVMCFTKLADLVDGEFSFSKESCKYSWKELMEMLDITDKKELLTYTKKELENA